MYIPHRKDRRLTSAHILAMNDFLIKVANVVFMSTVFQKTASVNTQNFKNILQKN